MEANDLRHLMLVAQEAAKDASMLAKKNLIKNMEIRLDLNRDVKVEIDFEIEAFIVKRLSLETGYQILSEESGLIRRASTDSNYRWIIDPLDGSLNFSRAIPIFCISIAFWRGMDPLVGVLYDFNRDEMFTGLHGEGAWINGKPIKVGCVREKKNAVLCTGFPVSTDFSESALLDFVRNIQSYKKVRILGSAALSLAYVASGRADVYQENNIALWDVAAGIAIVMAAGGVVRFSSTRGKNRVIVKAANKFLLTGDLSLLGMGK